MLVHPNRMAAFSAWANQRLHTACGPLSAADLGCDRGAFFRSILGTLNHILLVDMLYRDRLEGVTSAFAGLDEILHHDLAPLSLAQTTMDAYYVGLTQSLDEAALSKPVGFHTLLDEPEYWEVSRAVYFSNLFQHQVHHRGQAHNMLSQAGIDPPSIGYIEFEIELGEHVVRRPA
ncbi:MAG: putative damage-inducible protein DinB [Gammaproteobacteria bacterium]|jgi:uncharacterized damage-inducible protein DinB